MPDVAVRIAASVGSIAGGRRAGSSALAVRADQVWAERTSAMLRALGAPDAPSGPSAPGLFFADPVAAFPASRLDAPGAAPAAPVDRIATSMIERLVASVPDDAPRPGHVALGLAGDSVPFQSVLAGAGAELDPSAVLEASDPLAAANRAELAGMPSAVRHLAASSSGMHAVIAAAERVATGANPAALAVAASAASIPLPFPVVALGRGDDRDELPFTPGADGHHQAEGGVGFALTNGSDDDPRGALSIRSWAFGSFGTAVVNRQVLASTIERALASAGVAPDDRVLVDLYGRGNVVDDAAELSAVALLARTRPGIRAGYLKGDAHYTIGAHALRGLHRLVEHRSGRLDGPIHLERLDVVGRSGLRLDTAPEDIEWFVFPAYSVRGDCAVLVVRAEVA